jgi:methionyl-tRNA formyltransferase
MPSSLRIVFAGTPEFAATHLKSLIAAGENIVAVYTQPDRPAGRGKQLQASPVKSLALAHHIPLEQPLTLKEPAAQAKLCEWKPDLLIVVAYGLLLPTPVLALPRLGCVNVHASILPRWRGAAPIQRAIEAGDTETGITLMQMEAGLDTGPVFGTWPIPISPQMTAEQLHDQLAALGANLLPAFVTDLAAGRLRSHPQDNSLATYATKLRKEEGLIDWRLPSLRLLQRIRAFNPFPVCYSDFDGESVRIWSAEASAQSVPPHTCPGTILSLDKGLIHVATGDGAIALSHLQWPGKKPLHSTALLNGMGDKIAPGMRWALAANDH